VKLTVLTLLLLLLTASCAVRVSPTGGEKDVKPPKLLSSVPDTNSISFKGREVRLRFDEYVQLNDAQGQFIMSPLGKKNPEVNYNRREVIVKLPDSLRGNTTYVLNFGKSIVDLHEANALEDFRFVFSTGAWIDSLRLTGIVEDGWSAEAQKNISILAYAIQQGDTTDSLPFRRKPDYYSRSNENGFFVLSNMAGGIYRVFAVDDKNNNLLCDPVDERIGFLNETVLLPDSIPLRFRIALTEAPLPRLLRQTRADKVSAEVQFNKPVNELLLKDLSGNIWQGYHRLYTRRDTLALWLKDTISDSLQLVLLDGSQIIDTLLMTMSGLGGDKDPALKLRFNSAGDLITAGPDKDLLFRGLHPVTATDTLISLMEDSTSVMARLFSDSLDFTLMHIRYAWKPGSRYSLMIPPGTLRDVYGSTHDTLRSKFEFPTAEKSAELSVRLNGLTPGEHYLFELINEKQDVMRGFTVMGDTLLTMAFLPAGPARIRIIHDANRNGFWTGSAFGNGRQPEQVYYYPEQLQLRANWELEMQVQWPKKP
jgi:hypothetical protein